MKRVLRVLLSGFFLLVSLPPVFAVPYTLVRLDPRPGTLEARPGKAHFINNTGQIVGDIGVNGRDSFWRAALFDPTRGFAAVDLGTLGGTSSGTHCINDRGQIVGWAENSSGHARATLFDPTGGGNNIDLGTLGGNYSRAYAINENGQIVGEAENSSGHWRATLFDPTGGGNNVDLGTLGGNYSTARAINDQGQIVGRAYTAWSYGDYATVFDPSGNGDNTGTGTHTHITSINEHGQPVGFGCGLNCGATLYIYEEAGNEKYWRLQGLGELCDWVPRNTMAYCINNNGLVVGESCGRAAMFDLLGSPAIIDLNDLAVNRREWELTSGQAINDRNEIVGIAGSRAYLLTPDTDGDGVGDFYEIGPYDPDHDGDVDLTDFAEFSGEWHRDNCVQPDFCGGADTDNDGGVHLDDLLHFVRFWLSRNGG